MPTFEEILDSWSKAHDEITRAWLSQGKPEKVECWGELLDFEEAHNNLSRECNRQLSLMGYFDLPDEVEKPTWYKSEIQQFDMSRTRSADPSVNP